MDSIGELVAQAKQHFERKDYRGAETYLRQVLEKTDRYADVLNMMGIIHHAEGRFSSAIDLFKRALAINPNYTEAIMNLAVVYNDLGQYGEAKKLYAKLTKSSRGSKHKIEPVLRGKLSNLHAQIGDIYRSAGANGNAIDEYEKALTLNPTYVDIKTKLGQSLREAGQLNKALKVLREALKTKSSYVPARIQLGLTYYAQGKTTDAKKEWKTALNRDPDNDYARMYLRLVEAMNAARRKPARKKTSTRGA